MAVLDCDHEKPRRITDDLGMRWSLWCPRCGSLRHEPELSKPATWEPPEFLTNARKVVPFARRAAETLAIPQFATVAAVVRSLAARAGVHYMPVQWLLDFARDLDVGESSAVDLVVACHDESEVFDA